MKTKYFKIVWMTFMFIYLVNGQSQDADSSWSDVIIYQEPDTSFPRKATGITSKDQGPETIWMSTGWPLSGGIPYDILYVEDEAYPYLNSNIFIYTERKLLVYNMFVYDYWEPTLDLTEAGSQTLNKFSNRPFLTKSREKHLAYNPKKRELYCLTQDLKIIVIDAKTIEKTREIILDTEIGLLDWAILKYDPYSEYIFIGICEHGDSPEAELLAFNTIDYSLEYSINNLGDFNDFSFNPLYPLLYLSSNSEIQLRNPLDGSVISTYTMPCEMGVIVSAYNENSGLNKTYCLPKTSVISENNALRFNDNSTSPQTISIAKSNITCGTYNAPSDKVYLGYTYVDQSYSSGFISFDPDIENMIDHSLSDQDIIMDMANLKDRVFISSKDHIYCCKNGNYFPDYTFNAPNSFFFRITATN